MENNPEQRVHANSGASVQTRMNSRHSNVEETQESVSALVSHDVVPAMCQRLHAIEFFDVAEQFLQVLKRISKQHPLACLDSGAIMAVLSYIDLFSTSIQRVALCTMENICHQMLPSQGPSHFMDAVPILSKLLKYKDEKLVQDAASCLIKIGQYVDESSEIDELCKHDLIEHVTYLLSFKDRTVLHQDTYIELISLLAKLCSGSVVAFRTLHELNICSILEDILLSEFSYGASSSKCVGKNHSQVYEALMLLNQLLPAVTKDQNDPLIHDKEYFLANRPDRPQKLGMEMVPKLIQVFNSNAASVHVSHGCLSVMYKLVYWGKSDMFVALLKRVSISSFLTGAFTWKDHHVLILALQISELILQKFSYTFLYLFTKEGVFFVIDKLLSPETSSNLNFCQKLDSGESPECPCYASSSFQSRVSSEVRECKLDKDSIYNLSKHILEKYLAPGLNDSKKGLNDILMNLKILSADLNNFLSLSIDNGAHPMIEEKMNGVVHQILEVFSTKKLVSIFNLIEIGAVKSLVNYLSSGQYMRKSRGVKGFCEHDEVPSGDTALALLIRSLRSALAYLEPFPVILSNGHGPKFGESFAVVPNNCSIPYLSLNIRFIKDKGETCLGNYSEDTITVDPFCALHAIEEYLWPKVRVENSEQVRSSSIEEGMQEESSTLHLQSNAGFYFEESPFIVEPDYTLTQFSKTQDNADQEQKLYAEADPKLSFFLEGKQLHHNLTLYQAILCQKVKGNENFPVAELWNQVHTLTFRRAEKSPVKNPPSKVAAYNFYRSSFLSDMFSWELVSDFNKSNPTHDILFLLTFLEEFNRFRSHLVSRERIEAFALGKVDNLYNLKIVVPCVAQNEFVSKKLTDKLEKQMRDSSAVSIRGLPPWFNWLMDTCPFLLSFEARCKWFKLAAYGQPHNQARPSNENTSMSLRVDGWPHKKVRVSRNWILVSAAMMITLHADYKVVLEAEFNGEIGTGRGPTMEFYSLVSQGFLESGLGMWREDNCSFIPKKELQTEESMIPSRHGLFPRPWLSYTSNRLHRYSEVEDRFFLLGQVVAKAIQDGRILDLHLSKAFYKLILGKDLSIYDIESFDPELGRILLEFVALVNRKKHLESACREKFVMESELRFRGAKIEDLCLDFTLPGYPDMVPTSGPNHSMVTISNLEAYVSFITDATVRSGISKQMEAFKSGFGKFFPIEYLHIFTEEELEHILCGEQDSWTSNEIANHIKFKFGYTATSPPIVNLLEIIQEFDGELRRAFLQFVTGSPRLPLGGLASLNPKLTVVRKHFRNNPDTDLPSVTTCFNYLKLPPYSSKEIMKEKLLYAITEGRRYFCFS